MSKSYLVKGTFWIFIGMLFQQLMNYVNTVLALRFIDVSIYGTVVFLGSLVAIVAALSKQGMQVAATKFISEYVGKGDEDSAKGIFNNSKWLIIIVALALTIFSPFVYKLLPAKISNTVSQPSFIVFFIPFILISPLLRLNQAGFLGLKLTFLSSVTGFLLQPIFRIICILPILVFLPTVTGLIYTQIIPLIIAYLISEVLINQKKLGITLPSFKHTKPLYKFSLPLIGTDLLTLGIYQADRIFLGYMTNPESVGIYNVANKIAFLVIAPYWAGAKTLGPLISEYWSKQQMKELDEIYKYSTYLFLFLVGAVTIFIWINIKLILGVFGPQFVTTETIKVTMVLCLSLFLTILPGNFAQLIRMSGKTYLSTINTLFISSLNLVLNYFLIGKYGILGAAYATAIAILCGHLNGFIILKFIYKNAVTPFSYKYFLTLITILGLGVLFYFSKNLTMKNLLAIIILLPIGCMLFKNELIATIKKLKASNRLRTEQIGSK